MEQWTPIIGVSEEMLARFARPPRDEIQDFVITSDEVPKVDDFKVGLIVRVELNGNTFDQPIERMENLDNGNVRVFLGRAAVV